ncbi:polysaccharide pyruvyl transferase family protein [Agromyces atrinae]|uniref:Pyruvyl transferase n=1 Tax=Agromyces atrinae TaxID=592376 RepID=A0A852SHB8_9MICO|nr:polysaccharide pyruvyl transferase family protein [Agromyces atrinae]NYD68530.1 pyruvyl transferase [Agromyces atrinae]
MAEVDVRGVSVVHWNPQRAVTRFGVRIGRRPVDNFGDLIGPFLVDRLVDRQARATRSGLRLLTVGSIMRLAEPGDSVWGTGVNGKSLGADVAFGPGELDVRAVRGPLTQQFLERRGVAAPSVFGDPGLLVADLFDRDEIRERRGIADVTIVPNLHDFAHTRRSHREALDPRSPLVECIERIASSRLVVGSSLHGIVVAEAFGIPARLVQPGTEPSFKYDDYYRGTGRDGYTPAADVAQAVALGGEPPLEWDPAPLRAAFPHDLWQPEVTR